MDQLRVWKGINIRLKLIVLFALGSTAATTGLGHSTPYTAKDTASEPNNQEYLQTTLEPQGAGKGEKEKVLSLKRSIRLAIRHNFDVQIQGISPAISRYDLRASYGPYDPVFEISSEEEFESSPGGINPNTNEPFPANETRTDRFSAGFNGQLPLSGMRYSLSANAFKREGNFINPTEEFTGGAGVSVTQPLLRNFWIDATRQQIKVNRKNLKISELGFRNQTMQTVTQVERAYYNLIFAHENVKVRQKALELAKRLLKENARRVEVGAMAPLEEKQAESQVATSRADLLEARQQVELRENALKKLITQQYSRWHDLEIHPSETMVAMPADLDLQESWKEGLKHRPDLLRKKKQLERQNVIVRYRHNQVFPVLDLTASYGVNGVDRTFERLYKDYESRDNPRHSIGVVFRVPLSNKARRNRYQSSKASKEQLLLQLKKVEQNVMVEIDNAIKQAKTDFQRVQATREARQFSQAALEAEQKKLQQGKSTSFEVLRLQRDLTQARSAEIRALADYNISLAEVALARGTTLERNNIRLEME